MKIRKQEKREHPYDFMFVGRPPTRLNKLSSKTPLAARMWLLQG
ncbi:MAG: hypothetical protein ABFS43_07850 [Thermodesulfobacteriota bacterium]